MPKDSTQPTQRKSKAKADGSRKKKKDVNAPKRPLSAYMWFANENRNTVRTDNPSATFGQIGRLLGEGWKALSEEEKEPYKKKSADDKKRYEADMAEYKSKSEDSSSKNADYDAEGEYGEP